MRGGKGNDTIYGFEGHDTLRGGPGDDYVLGQSDGDKSFGDAGDDVIEDKFWGPDELYGGEGDDSLDAFDSQEGFDILDGGPHAIADGCISDAGDSKTNCEL